MHARTITPTSEGGRRLVALHWRVAQWRDQISKARHTNEPPAASPQGTRHAYIKPSSPQLNGKLERSHRADEQEFCQLLSYEGDVDLKTKIQKWERLHNLARPLGAHNAKAPHEALRENP